MPNIIRVSNLSKSFNGNIVLKDINLEIDIGSHVVILGRSGSGKTQLLNIMLGLLVPDNGFIEYLIDDKYIKFGNEENNKKIWQECKVVFQSSALLDSYSVFDNIYLPLILNRVDSTQAKRQTKKYLKAVGLSNISAEIKPSQLSGGMQKRVSIARALSFESKIIFYDEPTTGLDPETANAISELVYEINTKNKDMTSISVTHDYDYAIKNADIIYFLDNNTHNLIKLTDRNELKKFSNEVRKKEFIVNQIKKFQKTESQISQTYIKSKWKLDNLAKIFKNFFSPFSLLFKIGIPYKKSKFWHYFKSFGLNSIFLITIIGFFIGILVTLQFYSGTKDVRSIVDVNIPQAVTYNIFTLFAPILTGLLLSGKVATKISSDIGAKQYLQQINSLKIMGIDHYRFFLSPMLIVMIAVTPLLIFLFTLASVLGAYILWIFFIESGSYFLTVFLNSISIITVYFVLIRSITIGILITLISYNIGIKPKKSTEEISDGATLAFINSSIIILIFEMILNILFSFF